MRKLLTVLPVLAVVVAFKTLAGPPPTATGIWIDPTKYYAFTNCSATGSAAQTVAPGKYLLQVSGDESINVVYGTAYDGGTLSRFKNKNLAHLESFYETDGGGTVLSCQSAGGTGDLYLTGTH